MIWLTDFFNLIVIWKQHAFNWEGSLSFECGSFPRLVTCYMTLFRDAEQWQWDTAVASLTVHGVTKPRCLGVRYGKCIVCCSYIHLKDVFIGAQPHPKLSIWNSDQNYPENQESEKQTYSHSPIGPRYPWVPHSWIQTTVDQKVLLKVFFSVLNM
jgi:hypothetical protein